MYKMKRILFFINDAWCRSRSSGKDECFSDDGGAHRARVTPRVRKKQGQRSGRSGKDECFSGDGSAHGARALTKEANPSIIR